MVNPVFIYISIWLLVLFLYSLGLTSNLVEYSGMGMAVIVLNMASICLIYVFLKRNVKKHVKSEREDREFIYSVKKFLRFSLIVWLLGTIVEIIVCTGFPLYWKLVGDPRLYVDFGIPSFHGIMNAFYLQALSMAAYLFMKEGNKKLLLLILVLLIWPICMLGRGILLSGVLQMACIFLMMRKINIKVAVGLLVVALLAVLMFGYLGDLRQTANPFGYLVTGPSREVFNELPSGFLWFYVYLTCGLSNFFYNIDSLNPVWGVSYTLANLFPTVLRNFFEFDTRNDLFELVDPGLNTSTIYAGPVSDMGALGGFVLVAFTQLVCCYIYILSLKGKPWGFFAYTVAFQVLMFSVFFNMLFLLPTLFQFVVCIMLYLYHRLRRRPLLEKAQDGDSFSVAVKN